MVSVAPQQHTQSLGIINGRLLLNQIADVMDAQCFQEALGVSVEYKIGSVAANRIAVRVEHHAHLFQRCDDVADVLG